MRLRPRPSRTNPLARFWSRLALPAGALLALLLGSFAVVGHAAEPSMLGQWTATLCDTDLGQVICGEKAEPAAQALKVKQDATRASTAAAKAGPPATFKSVRDKRRRPVRFSTSTASVMEVVLAAQPATAPEDEVDYSSGFFRYSLTKLAKGATVDVTMTLPAGLNPNHILRCNRRLPATCSQLASGVSINSNVVRLTVKDGGVGDSDGAINGKITDLVAPAVVVDDGKVDLVPPTVDAGGADGWHLAALGPLAGASVTVVPLTMPDTVIEEAVTNENGFFTLSLDPEDAQFDDDLLLVTVEGGMDTDANDDGVRDATPTPNEGTLNLLILGSRLKSTSVSVSILSDAVFRTIEAYLDTLPQPAILQSLEELAYGVLKDDIDGDGAISYDDITAFNPTRAADKAKLEIDYADVFVKDEDGRSLADKYHADDGEEISIALNDLFSAYLIMDIPTTDDLAMVDITINGGVGGVVASPDLRQIELGMGNRQFVHKAAKTDPAFVLEATADPGFMFTRWVGCPEVQANNTCRVTPATVGNAIISAQYMFTENKLAPGMSMEMALQPVPGKFGVTFKGPDELLLTVGINDAAARAKLDAIALNALVLSGVMKRPQVKVLAVNSRGSDPTGDFYQASFQIKDVDVFEAYTQFSAQAPDRPVVMDDLTAVSYQSEIPKPDQGIQIQMPTQINKPYVEGPTPSGMIDQQGSCPSASDEEVFTTEVDSNNDPVIACIEEGAEPVASAADCAANERTIEIIDGRLYCIPTGGVMAAKRFGSFYKAAYGHAMPTLVKTGGPGRPVMSALTPEVRKAKAEGRLSKKTTAREVFILGYGRAFELGDGRYLANDPEGPGLTLLETDGKPERLDAATQRASAYKMTCATNRYASGCGAGRLIKTQEDGFKVFPGNGLELELSDPGKYAFLKVVVTLQLNINSRSMGNFNYLAPVRVEFNTTGFVTITPTVGVNFKAQIDGKWEKSGKPKDPPPPGAKLERALLSYDFAQNAQPAGAFVSGKVELALGVEVVGAISIENKVKLPITTRFDGEVAAGWGCRRLGGFLGLIPEDCSGDQRFNFKVKSEIKYAYTLTGSANVTVEPYVELRVVAGLRGVGDRFVRVATRGFVQGELLVEGPTLKLTNIPEELSAQGGKTSCVDGGFGGISGNLYYGIRGYAEITSEGSPIDRVFTFNKTFQIAEFKEKFASYGWDIFDSEKKQAFAKKENVGFNIRGLKKDPEPCIAGVGAKPKDEQGNAIAVRTFKPGQLDLQDNAYFATTTRQLAMQKDGNLVFYNYDGEEGKQKEALFASNTGSQFNTRFTYQGDGNLVIYNILDDRAVWAAGTQGNPKSLLRMQDDGQLLMYKTDAASAYPIWGRELTQKAGSFTLNAGDSILTFNRKLFMQEDGNLVLYKFDQRGGGQRESLFASNTGGNMGAYATFQPDGNLVVYNSMGRAIWSTGTSGLSNATLKLQLDGNLVLYRDNGSAAFATNTSGR